MKKENKKSMEDPDSMVELWWPGDHAEAYAIKQALEDQGVPCYIDGENLASLVGGAFVNIGRCRMRLLTLRKFYKQAREFIEDHDWPSYMP